MRCPPPSACGLLSPCWRWAASSNCTIFQNRVCISTGLLAEDIFHTGENGIFGISDQAAFAFIHLLGLFIGASLLAPLADKLGRRHTFMFALAWYGIFSLIMALQNSAEGVIFCRFLVGIGLGIELVTIDTYLSEWVPTHLRNKAFAFAFFIQFLSVPAVALMSWMLVPITLASASPSVISSVPCSLVIWVICKSCRSQRAWLDEKGRHEEAHEVMCEMEQRCGVFLLPSPPCRKTTVSAQNGCFQRDLGLRSTANAPSC